MVGKSYSVLSTAGACSSKPAKCISTKIKTSAGIALLFLVQLLCASAVSAQSIDSRGTEFWLAFPQNHSGGVFTPSFFISSSTATSATIEVPALEFIATVELEANVAQSVTLPVGVEVRSIDAVTDLGIHVTSEEEITVYGLSRLEFTTDAFLGLPVDVLGTEYIVSAWGGTSHSPSQYTIVGTEDNTTVSITPSALETCAESVEITINEGQTYYHASCSNLDTTGTVITATAPIAVYGGHQCANVPNDTVFFCDHLIEQLPPTQAWGTQFLTAPLASRVGGDTFRILASQDDTNVFVNDISVAVLARGEFFQTLIDGPAVIETTGPALVVQFSNGTTFDDVTSDPFKMIIPPFEQFLADYTFSVPTEGFQNNFVNIVVDERDIPLLVLDGISLEEATFTAIQDSGFSYAQISLEPGSHSLTGAIAGIFTYGYDDFDSYGYPGGLSLSEVALVSEVNLLSEELLIEEDGLACALVLVTDSEEQPIEDIRVDFEITIDETILGNARTDIDGIAEFCIALLEENQGKSATIVARVGSNESEAEVSVEIINLTIDGEAVSGSGSAGIFSVLMLSLLGFFRSRAAKGLLACFCSLLGLASVTSQADSGWVLGVRGGQTQYNDVDENIAPVVNQEGNDLVTHTDDVTTGYTFYVGYKFSELLAVEAGYLNLGDYRVTVSGETEDPEVLSNELNDALEPSIRGFNLGVSSRIGLGSVAVFNPRASVVLYNTEIESEVAGFVETTDESSAGFSAGASLLFPLSEVMSVGVGYDVYWNDDNDMIGEFFSVGFEYKFVD